jgi:hypothetical protein
MVDKHVFTQGNVFPEIGMERGKYGGALVYRLPDYLRQARSNLGNISGSI